MATSPSASQPSLRRIRYVPAIGPRLKKLLYIVFALFALLAVNSAYLASVTLFEWYSGQTYQDYFYQLMFLFHLLAGLLLAPVVLVFGGLHLRNAWPRPNRRAVRAGLALFSTAVVLIASGLVLTRFDFFEVKNPLIRGVAYWMHVIAPSVVAWLFVLHRLAGKRIKWKVGGAWAAVAVGFALVMVGLQAQDPRQWNVIGPKEGEKYFFPSLSRTSNGNFIPARILINDRYCSECHADIHKDWSHSVHRFASFNNPAYLFSVRETRKVALERDGSVQAARFCAGCHDPAPLFSGAFDDPEFDDVNHPTAKAGITCTVCHAITHLNTRRGNADYTIEEPLHYPFAFSDNPVLRWINRQLIKAKPEFHKKTFLKPLHRTPEFCAACHKVHLPPELNHYKWLRGQNHYDSYHLSGVSGHGIASFYYPSQAVGKCAQCHMPLQPSGDFGADFFDDSGMLKVHNHLFPAANTAIPYLLGMPETVIKAHQAFLRDRLRLDIFALREGGDITGELHAPLRPEIPALQPGQRYLLDIVIRTTRMGHHFTQGTADSNEIWLDLTVRAGDRIIGRSGSMAPDGEVDPWSYFVNAYVLDRDGNRIDRRNAQDIFVPLYNHQIPPGAADVVHYAFRVPADVSGPVTVEAKLRYRKFDTTYMRYFQGEQFAGNDLPITTLAEDSLGFPVLSTPLRDTPSSIPEWERWNDYGIGLLRKGNKGSSKGELRQAEAAFLKVEAFKPGYGALNRARVYLKEGRLDEAVAALKKAGKAEPPAPPWSVAWFTGLLNEQNGFLDQAIDDFRQVVDTRFPEARQRGFDFSQDYRVLNELGQTLFERARQARGDAGQAQRFLDEATVQFKKVLELDPENVTAHYNLALIYALTGRDDLAQKHRELHARYKPDDNARDRAVALQRRRNPAANHAAEAVVIYDLQRQRAYYPAGDKILARQK